MVVVFIVSHYEDERIFSENFFIRKSLLLLEWPVFVDLIKQLLDEVL